MEIERPRKPEQVPSAPEFDQESLTSTLEELPERVERHRFGSRIRRLFSSKYRRMREGEAPPAVSEEAPAYTTPNPPDDSVLSGNLDRKNVLLRKLYWLFCGQMSLFTGLTALFYYVPHIRQMFRKTFADKILYKSIIGPPLGIAVLIPILFQSVRRRYASFSSLALTTCLSCLLCYAMSYQSDNLPLLMEMALTDGCFATATLLNYAVPKFSMRNRLEALFFPGFMVAGQALQPLLLRQSISKTWYCNLFFVLGSGYLGNNLRSVMNDQQIALKPNEAPFALFQSYVNFNPSGLVARLFRGSPSRSSFQRI